jgi:hypothetical protein
MRHDEPILRPAVVRVRVAGSPGPGLVEAVLTRSLATLDPPVVAEAVWVPVLSRSSRRRDELTYALVLAPTSGSSPSGADEDLVRRMRRTMRKAVRRELGCRCEVAVRLARGPEEVAACFRAMVGNPRDVHV